MALYIKDSSGALTGSGFDDFKFSICTAISTEMLSQEV
jgi:hypothetical protein